MSNKPKDSDKWEVPDVADMLAMLGQPNDRDFFNNHQHLEPSGGFQHGTGEYVIDPDYMEVLGLTPEELIKGK